MEVRWNQPTGCISAPLLLYSSTTKLVERLAKTIATSATGQPIKRKNYYPDDLDDDETSSDTVGGMAIMRVWPVDGMYSNLDD